MVGGTLLNELRRIDGFLVQTARRLYEERAPDNGEFRGLFITDHEFLQLLEQPFGASLVTSAPAAFPPLSEEDRWTHLKRVFDLSATESQILLICLLPEFDLRYERIFGFLQDDVTCKRPIVDLLLALLWPDLGARLAARTLFHGEATLSRYGLMILSPPAEGPDTLLRRTAQVAPQVVRFLLSPDKEGPASASPYWRGEDSTWLPDLYPAEAREAIWSLITSGDRPLWIQVRSDRSWTSCALAQDCAAQQARPMVTLSVDDSDQQEAVLLRVQQAARDALLYDAVLYVEITDRVAIHDSYAAFEWATLLEHPGLTVVWHTPRHTSLPQPASEAVRVAVLDLPAPDYEGRLVLWQRALQGRALADPDDLPVLAARYRLDGAQIHVATRGAAEHAWQRRSSEPVITFDDLAAASRAVSAVRLGDLASQIVARHTWEDLVLPADRTAQIHEMCDQFRFRHVVYGAWGFGRQSARGQGLSALFAGPSGTGKTMAAEVIATDLSLDLYKIDLSGVVSKYIGETEKNLDRIFDLARDSNAILLFDEADALFGKRSETKDAHDRYANIEISYLLQKVEEYDGVVILTSNLRQNLDEAFLRRLQFSIEFPFPDEASRRLIWERTVPAQLPLAADVDLASLAGRFRLSGGSIRNALVNAAFLAARDGEIVAMRHLLWGVRREFQKLGKLIDEDDFGMELVRRVVAIHDASARRSGR